MPFEDEAGSVGRPLVVWGVGGVARSIQGIRRLLRGAEEACNGLCTHVLSPTELEALTIACYAGLRYSAQPRMTLFEWEKRLFERVLAFPFPGKLSFPLVL